MTTPSEGKIFAGPRLRRIRLGKGLSQTAMAGTLGISPSYLNLLERNQRPLTAALILKLAAAHGVEAAELQSEGGGALAALREVFADPLLAAELPGESELIDFAEATPNAAAAMLKLHRAYREQSGRLSDLGELLAKEGRAQLMSGARLPLDEVREVLERRPAHFSCIEREAESFSTLLEPGDDLFAALKAWLRREHGIAVRALPVATMPLWRRRYDRHSHRLFLSERLSPFDQLLEVAIESCLLRMRGAIAAEVENLKLSTDEARRLARFELGRLAAHALLMPVEPFRAAAKRLRHDVDALAARFRVSFAQAATRLTMGPRGDLPFFAMEVDSAGHHVRKSGAEGFPHRSFGGGCPKLAVHAAFAQPGRVAVEAVEMPDGTRFLTVARTLDGPRGAWNERPRRTALLLGCELRFRDDVAYADALPAFAGNGEAEGRGEAAALVPVGPVCRLCERVGCLSRAEPPVTRPLGLDEMVAGVSAFDFQ